MSGGGKHLSGDGMSIAVPDCKVFEKDDIGNWGVGKMRILGRIEKLGESEYLFGGRTYDSFITARRSMMEMKNDRLARRKATRLRFSPTFGSPRREAERVPGSDPELSLERAAGA